MSFWRGRRVFLTGHTGFKGSWLALWLTDMGAEVTGFSLPAPTHPSLFEMARVAELVTHIEGDIRDAAALEAAMVAAGPEVVLHLAAQPLVRYSYDAPIETYATNVMGTVHLLDACRRLNMVKAVVVVTSDKCYENREQDHAYREDEPMGGHDPYSNSKGCAELVVSAYRQSYFGSAGPAVASVRAGNVIGGGDWAMDRLIPDIVRAAQQGEAPLIRAPQAVRPWQHVLEPLAGYLLLAEKLATGDRDLAEGWNFGPARGDTQPVGWIVERLMQRWGLDRSMMLDDRDKVHEATLLMLDSGKAQRRLGWRAKLNLDMALDYIVDWHRTVDGGGDARQVSLDQIRTRQALPDLSPDTETAPIT